MSSNLYILFTTNPQALASFYTTHCHLAPPKESRINGRLQLTFQYFGGEVRVRESQRPTPPSVPEAGLPVRLPEGLAVETVAQQLEAAGLQVELGRTPKGLPFVAVRDPLGIRWELRAHTK